MKPTLHRVHVWGEGTQTAGLSPPLLVTPHGSVRLQGLPPPWKKAPELVLPSSSSFLPFAPSTNL